MNTFYFMHLWDDEKVKKRSRKKDEEEMNPKEGEKNECKVENIFFKQCSAMVYR